MKKQTKKFWLGITVLLTFAVIYIIFLPENGEDYSMVNREFLNKLDTTVYVTREPARGLTEKDLTDMKIINIMEEKLITKYETKVIQSYKASGINKNIEPDIKGESWGVTKGNRNFVIVRLKLENFFQVTSIIGIKGGVLIKISCSKYGESPVPHSYGPCAKKMEELFGFSLSIQ